MWLEKVCLILYETASHVRRKYEIYMLEKASWHHTAYTHSILLNLM